jgi:hypothetical protein
LQNLGWPVHAREVCAPSAASLLARPPIVNER